MKESKIVWAYTFHSILFGLSFFLPSLLLLLQKISKVSSKGSEHPFPTASCVSLHVYYILYGFQSWRKRTFLSGFFYLLLSFSLPFLTCKISSFSAFVSDGIYRMRQPWRRRRRSPLYFLREQSDSWGEVIRLWSFLLLSKKPVPVLFVALLSVYDLGQVLEGNWEAFSRRVRRVLFLQLTKKRDRQWKKKRKRKQQENHKRKNEGR